MHVHVYANTLKSGRGVSPFILFMIDQKVVYAK